MPELIVSEAKTKTLSAPYGDSVLNIEVRAELPLFAMLRNMVLMDRMSKLDINDSGAVMEVAAALLVDVAAASWDLTSEGEPVPLTKKAFEQMADSSPTTVIKLLTDFGAMIPTMVADFAARAKAAKKSRGGNLPSLNHGRKGKPARRKPPKS